MAKLNERAILRLVDTLYSCVDSESPWSIFLNAVLEYFGATVVGISAPASPVAGIGTDSVEADRYQRYYAAINPWFKRGQVLSEGKILRTDEVLSQTAYRKTAFYNEWGKRNLVSHAIGGAFRVSPNSILFLAINRGDANPPFDECHMKSAQLLMPHLRRAFNLQNRLSAIYQRAWALDHLAFPMMYISSRGVVRWANGAAEQLFQDGNGLYLKDGRLRAYHATEDTRLTKMMTADRALLAGRVSGFGGWLHITSPTDGTVMSLFLVRPPHHIVGCSQGLREGHSGFLVFVASQKIHGTTLANRLRKTWSLSAAEAALAVELLESQGLQSAAEKLQISRNTAKTQLASVFQKAEVRRQGELVRKILAIGAVGSPSED